MSAPLGLEKPFLLDQRLECRHRLEKCVLVGVRLKTTSGKPSRSIVVSAVA